MAICIPQEFIEDVKKIVENGSSITRQKELTKLFGSEKTAKEINTLYENSLLLKNQKSALDKFINNIDGTSAKAKIKLKEQIAERFAKRTDKIQNDELLSLAQDIWNKKYSLDINLEDIQKINALKVETDALKKKLGNTPAGSSERLDYGRKVVELRNIVAELKNPREALGFVDTVKTIGKQTASRFDKEKGVLGNIGEGLKLSGEILTSAVYKSVQASADMSYGLRQGFKVLTKNPSVWKENWTAAFKPFTKIGSKAQQQAVADEWAAHIVSHPLYEKAMNSKLALGVAEDFFPTTLADKIPALGNIFKASNEAFTIFTQGSRLGLFEDMYNKALAKGIKMTPELEKSIASVANSITGRGSLGRLESVSGTINKILYSGRYVRSALDTFFMPFNTKLEPFARTEALKSSVATLSTIAGLMYAASLFTEVEWDPRSSQFLKAKILFSRDKWVDLSAGIGGYITLAAKQATGESKSTKTGRIIPLDSNKFGSQTRFDVAVDWLTNKLAPAPSIAVQYAKGRDYQGNKPTLGSSAVNLVKPISAGNTFETLFSNEDDLVKLISVIADINGVNQTDYTKFKK